MLEVKKYLQFIYKIYVIPFKIFNSSGLIQLRNELVHFISSNKLPQIKNEERLCSRCPMLTVCSLFNERQKLESEEIINYQNESEIYSNSLRHLNEEHKEYFFKWFKMLEIEFGDQKQFEAGNDVWWKPRDELESSGWTVFDLQLENNEIGKNIDDELEEIQYSGEGFFLFEFKREPKYED